MTNRTRIVACAAALCALISAPTASAAPEAPRKYPAVASALGQVHQGMAREQYIANILNQLRQFDKNTDGLTAAEIDLAETLAEAQHRAQNLNRLYGYDLNNDGRIDNAEVGRVIDARGFPRWNSGPDMELHRERQIAEVMKADADNDGAIDFGEARAYRQQDRVNHATDRARELLDLDPNKNGRLTAQELEALARAAFAAVDTDGNGVVSVEEVAAYRKATRPEQASYVRGRRTCDIPKPDPAHRLIVVGSYEGEALSTATVVGQDAVTTASRVEIEQGADPLYVLLISDRPRIWQVTGATGRIARVTLASRDGAGVTGIAREKVSFLPPGECLLLNKKPDEIRTAILRGALNRAIGRAPDAIVGEYGIATVKLPSGVMVKPKRSYARPSGYSDAAYLVWRELLKFAPAGVVQIDANTVVASNRAESYEVLPQEAGLLQLVKEGALARTGNHGFRLTFKIVKPMKRFPAGLAGAHSVAFLLTKGVAMPQGNRGHSCVIAEATGLPVSDSSISCDL